MSKLVKLGQDDIQWRKDRIWGIGDLFEDTVDHRPGMGHFSFVIMSTTGSPHIVWAGGNRAEAERLHKAAIDMLEASDDTNDGE